MVMSMLSENVPSQMQEVLSVLLECKLERIVRYSWCTTEEAIREYNLAEEDVFSLTSGPVLMYFDSGLVVGAASDPEKNSVVLWIEKNEKGEVIDEPLEDDEELFPIDAKNQPGMWANLNGKNIASFKVIYRKPVSAKMEQLPNEVGLAIVLNTGEQFILSHGLHDNSDDFSIITKDQINKSLTPDLVGI